MSTTDCKELLMTKFPSTSVKEWKRISKFKNYGETVIREFEHPVVGRAFVHEDWSEVITDPRNFEVRRPKELSPMDFIFGVVVVPSSYRAKYPDEPYAIAFFTYKDSWDSKEGFDYHLECALKGFWPKGIKRYEACECEFEIKEELPQDELIAKFAASGFLHRQDLEDMIAENHGFKDFAK